MPTRSILDYFDVSLDFFTEVVLGNPSLRGMIYGYISEAKLKEILQKDGRATAFRKDDDHDRKKKGDVVITYEGFEFKIEVKGLQTNSVEIRDDENSLMPDDGVWVRKMLKKSGRGQPNPSYLPIWEKNRMTAHYKGQFQCDASDRRMVTFPDNSKLETTNLLFGEFHILAAGLFTFREKWDFGFALNRDLPASTNPEYPEAQRKQLITSMIPITWPLQAPFTGDIYSLLDILVAEERAKQQGKIGSTEVVAQPPAKVVTEEPAVKVVKTKPKKKS